MNLVELKELDLSGVNLKIYEGPIGISCSGGADSSLLLYFLMKYSKNKIYIFSSGNKARQFKNITITNNVIQKCIELTGNINIEHHSTFCDHQTLSNIFDKTNYYIKNKVREKFKDLEKAFKEESEEIDKTIPNCKYVLSSNEFGERFAIGYAKRLLLDLKKRMSAKQTKKAKALAIELKASIT